MNGNEALYMTAQEAAATLSVSPATIYAYVSRGLIRSEASAEGRAKRYRAEDVRQLKERRAPAEAKAPVETGTPFAFDSAICLITPEGPFYRGASAAELSQHASFEHVATLLWDAKDGDPFAETGSAPLWHKLEGYVAALADRPFTDRAAAIMALASSLDPAAFNGTNAGGAAIGVRAIRLLTALATGRPPSRQPIHRQLAEAWAPGKREAADLLRRALVLIADHELNASTFAARVAVSTGTSVYDALSAALTTLKGPRHGGASTRAVRFIARLAASDAETEIKDLRAMGERLPGFGHMLYRAADPRAVALLKALTAAGADRRLTEGVVTAAYEIAGVDPNIDFAHGVMAHFLGLPPLAELTIFAIGRTAGWTAHAMEQRATGQLIRPRARYVGPAPRGA
ncbi:MAG: citrate synthase family protein [Alphaproteobacteria bacterium]|nr:citrate synthase family protein [Alphaproteobacteria bacterium]